MKQEMSLKKTLPEKIMKLRKDFPEKKLRVFAMDECRLGLMPILRYIWAPKGKRPIVDIYPRYKWFYVFSAVEPTTGDNFSLICDCVCLEMMQHWLDEFSKTLEKNEICLLVLDGAGWHNEKGLEIPENIILLFQPPYSPECNPAERLWTWIRERLANKIFKDLNELKYTTMDIINDWDKYKDILKSWLCYHWWQEAQI